jgi:prepilin-type N-terminal cleavage/methylation domain-containing protein
MRTGRRAFTLVEVLVVVGIISVLAGIILPVMMQARRKAREATCISNLRQLAAAWEMYCEDSDDIGPTYLPMVNQYAKGPGIFRCPADPNGRGRWGEVMWHSFTVSGVDPHLHVPFPVTYSYSSDWSLGTEVSKRWSQLEEHPQAGIIACVCHGEPWERGLDSWTYYSGLVLRARPDGSVLRAQWPGTYPVRRVCWDEELGLPFPP